VATDAHPPSTEGTASPARTSERWDDRYGGDNPPPWDIGRPQPVFLQLADRGWLAGRLLDAGCGTGEHTILAAQRGARALGVDLSNRAVAAGRRKAAERGVPAEFAVADALDLAALGEEFDAVLDCGLFHVFDDTDRARYVDSVTGVVRDGGVLHLMCFSDRQPGDWGPRRVTREELEAAFRVGWVVEDLTSAAFDIRPAYREVFGTATAAAWLVRLRRAASRPEPGSVQRDR
jgi:SAM-dependent methyltransferase